jgi:hypothetical protein
MGLEMAGRADWNSVSDLGAMRYYGLLGQRADPALAAIVRCYDARRPADRDAVYLLWRLSGLGPYPKARTQAPLGWAIFHD